MRPKPLFRERTHAGHVLALHLGNSLQQTNAVVLALPRGGVPVGFEVARQMRLKLDVFLVRKLGLPAQEELAIGAIASGGVRVLNEPLINEIQLARSVIDQITVRQQQELVRRERLYREGRPAIPVQDRTVILVDDGLATGATMKAAVRALRLQRPERIIVAVPVAAREACRDLSNDADRIVCAETPEPFLAVGLWYDDFGQTTDEEVQYLLQQAAEEPVY